MQNYNVEEILKVLKDELTTEQLTIFNVIREQEGIDTALANLPEPLNVGEKSGYPTLNKNIKALRTQCNLTQTILANMLNVTQKEYWRMEKEGYNISAKKLLIIASLYNISFEWLMGFSKEQKPLDSNTLGLLDVTHTERII